MEWKFSFNEETQQKTLQFGSSVNPLKDRGWMLSPIRRVLDAVQQRRFENSLSTNYKMLIFTHIRAILIPVRMLQMMMI